MTNISITITADTTIDENEAFHYVSKQIKRKRSMLDQVLFN